MTLETDPEIDTPRKRLRVIGGDSTPELCRLLGGLEAALPVRFDIKPEPDWGSADGAIVLDPNALSRLPRTIPRLVLAGGEGRRARGAPVALADHDRRLAAPLRGRTIHERAGSCELPLPPPRRRSVLAATARGPVWWQEGEGAQRLSVSAYPLARPAAAGALRDHLKPGSFMELLPLLHFLGELLVGGEWDPAPLRASFVIDDPNLRWPSYGYLRYADVTAHAQRHGYHLGLAMVPIDGRIVSHRAAGLVRCNPSSLSILMHGNDHRSRELIRPTDDTAADAVIAQALCRTAAFERRSGVRVERVMVPPHEVCSLAALAAMLRAGLEAACIGQRYPWRDQAEPAAENQILAKWHPADFVSGGLPILPRHSLSQPWEELIFRALLRQPLILYGHHGDFAQGLEVLAEASEYVNGLGVVEWGPASWIARNNVFSRRSGRTLTVQMHSRRTHVDVPEGVDFLRVEIPACGEADPAPRLICGCSEVPMRRGGGGWRSGCLPVAAGARLGLGLAPASTSARPGAGAPAPTPWPLLRRALAEARDRAQPHAGGLPGRIARATERRPRRGPAI